MSRDLEKRVAALEKQLARITDLAARIAERSHRTEQGHAQDIQWMPTS